MRTNHSKITREFCERNILFFYPATETESQAIQKELFRLGFAGGKSQTQTYLNGYCQTGILLLGTGDSVNKAGIYNAVNSENFKSRGLLCTLSQFERGDGPEIKSQDEATLREEFNEMSAQLKKMAAQIEEMHEQIMPRKIDKPSGPKL